MSPTIKEIAKRAGVSYSTVSRALNNKPGVRPEVREAIKEIARKANYQPHLSARALVSKHIGVIGVAIPRTSEFAFQNPFYSHILLGLGQHARSKGYHLLLSINDPASYASLYQKRLVDGVVVVANRIDDERIGELAEQDIPAVVVPGFPKGTGADIPTVNTENDKSVERAVSYLISLGHRRIAFILGQLNSQYSLERLGAYRRAFSQNGLDYDQRYVVESDFSKTDGFRLMGNLLDLKPPPSAVICINDSVTPGALHQINSRGLSIPDDISLLAIGCSDNLELFHPPLTSIKTHVVEVGRQAARMLIQLVEEGRCESRDIVIPSELIIRDSTGPCN